MTAGRARNHPHIVAVATDAPRVAPVGPAATATASGATAPRVVSSVTATAITVVRTAAANRMRAQLRNLATTKAGDLNHAMTITVAPRT